MEIDTPGSTLAADKMALNFKDLIYIYKLFVRECLTLVV